MNNVGKVLRWGHTLLEAKTKISYASFSTCVQKQLRLVILPPKLNQNIKQVLTLCVNSEVGDVAS